MTSKSNLAVSEVTAKYLTWKTLQNKSSAYSDKSLARLRFYLGRFNAMFGERQVADCRSHGLAEWLLAHPEWVATSTKHDAVGQVVACFKWGVDEELLDKNPFRRPKHLGPPSKPRPAMEQREFRAMWRVCRSAKTKNGRKARTSCLFRAALLFLWRTGARTCEMRTAIWDGLDWQRGILSTKSKTEKVTGEDRLIPVRRLLPLFRVLWARRRDGATHIFVNTQGRPWTCDRFASEFRRYAGMAGVREGVTGYCCRHAMCVRLIEAGCNDKSVADVMGHRNTKMIGLYARLTRTKADHLNETVAKDRSKRK